jgi:hypothetical protein
MSTNNVGNRIPVPDIAQQDTRLLEFSFKHLDITNAKFELQRCTREFLGAMLESIQAYSNDTVAAFVNQNNQDHRHINVFDHTTEPDGFTTLDEEQLAYNDAWQFASVRRERWRVCGMLIENVFYVVWLDPDHLLCP